MPLFSSIRVKLIILLLFIIIPAIAITFYLGMIQREKARNSVSHDTIMIAKSIGDIQNSVIKKGKDILFTLSQIPHFKDHDSDYSSKILRDLLEKSPEFTAFSAYRMDGKIFASSAPSIPPLDITDRPYFKEIIRSHKFTVSDFLIGRVTGKPTLILAHPVLDSEKRMRAILVAGIDLNWVKNFIEKMGLSPGTSLTIIDKKGMVLFRHPEGEKFVGKSFPEAGIIKTVLSKREGTSESMGLDGVKKLFGFTPFGHESISGYVMVGIPKKLAFKEINRMLLSNILLLCLIGGIGIVGILVGGNLLIRNPIKRLLKVTEEISKGNLTVRTGLDYSRGEIGGLSQAVDRMAESLLIRDEEIEKREEVIRNQRDELFSRSEILSSTVSTKDMDELLRKIINEIVGFLKIEFASLHLVMGNQLLLRAYQGFSPSFRAKTLSFPLDEAPHWMKEFMLIHESLDEDKLTPEFIKAEGIQTLASVPLRMSNGEERWLGTLIVGSKDINAINEDKVRALKVLAEQLALGIEHVRSLRDARERLSRLETLRDIDRAIIKRLDLKEVLKVVVEKVPKELGADVSAISLIEEGSLKTKVFLMRVNGGRYIEEECFSMAESLLNSFINLKKTVIIFNLAEDPRIQMFRDRIRNGRFFSYLGVPLISGEKTTGILHIITREPKVFSDEDVEFFKTLAGQAAIAIENAKLFESLKEELGIRTRAEEALRETTLRLNHLLNTSPTIIYSCKVEGDRILPTWVSSNITSILGYNPEEVIKPDWWINNLHPEDRDKAITNSSEIFTKGNLVHEYRFLKKNRDSIWLRDELRLIRDSEGNPTEIVGAWVDITELKKMDEKRRSLEEQLFQSQKMEAIGRLAGGVAHDFNNILSIIKGYNQLLMLDIKEGDPRREGLKEINEAVDRAVAMTRQLLAFSRKQVLEMRVLDLNSVIRNLEKMLRRMIGEDIELRTILSEDIGKIEADPGQIEQVIMNLAVNSRDAMPYGGKLTIETKNIDLDEEDIKGHVDMKPGKYVMLSVSDTGIGMTKEVQDRIFEPFFTTKGVGKGTGLGLATVYGIVKQSGGDIWVYSEPGKGTIFKIYLPRVDKPAEELRAREEAKEIPRGNETILLVEDDEKVRRVAQRILEKQGYDIIEARNGEEAIEICKEIKKPVHLVLTDVVMPEMGGRELIERIKEVCKDFKVLYMSGYTDDVILRHGILEEGIAFIQKPFTLESLARKVREVLNR